MAPLADPAALPAGRLVWGPGHYRAVAVGCSAGGPETLCRILGALPADYALPVLVVQHLHARDDGGFAEHLASVLAMRVKEADDKESLEPGTVYTAPANYHLLVEDTGQLALSTDEKVNSSRPAIDVLFESAARVWARRLV